MIIFFHTDRYLEKNNLLLLDHAKRNHGLLGSKMINKKEYYGKFSTNI